MAGGTNGTALTIANLTTATPCGNGVWTISPATLTTFTFSNANPISYPGPQGCAGSTYLGNSGLSIAETISTTKESITYTFLSLYTESTVGFYYLTTANPATTAKWDSVALETASAAGFIFMYQQSLGSQNQLCLEQSSTGGGVGCVNISANHQYWITMELNTNTLLVLRVFDGTTFLPLGTVYGVGNTDTSVAYFIIGDGLGVQTGTPNGTVYISNVILDYANSTFALLPDGVSFATMNAKSTIPAGTLQ